MTFEMLPLVRCARCSLRGIPLALGSCPRCGASSGWAQIDLLALGAFMVALHLERVERVRRLTENLAADLRASTALRPSASVKVQWPRRYEPDLTQRAYAVQQAAAVAAFNARA